MTLTFLGKPYQSTASEVAQVTPTQTGKYRGVPVHFTTAQVSSRSHVQLSYRGIRYSH